MAVTYETSIKNRRMTAVAAAIDSGAGAGIIELGSAGMANTLVTVTLNDPCITGSATLGVITFAGFPKTGTAAASGTLGAARIRDSNNADQITGLSCSTGNAEVIVDNTSININQLLVINSIIITHG